MRILLVDPPFQRFIGYYRFYFPLGLTYLAAILKQAGHEVLIYDAEHDLSCISPSMKEAAEHHTGYEAALKNDKHALWLEYKKMLQDFKPDVVGVSILTVKLASAVKIAAITKCHNKSIKLVAGGEHVTVRPQDALSKGFDYVVCGEGEQGFLKVLSDISEKKVSQKIIKSVLIDDLDTLPFPSLESLHSLLTYRPIDLGLMLTARGCPFACTFCGLPVMYGNLVRHHSISRIIQEIEYRKKIFSVRYFSFRNGTFSIERRKVVDFCNQLISRNIDIQWECLTRVDVIDADLLLLMKKAGCVTIRIGVESGSDIILGYMKKNITLTKIRQAARLLHESGIFWAAYFMIGVPIETEQTIKETVALIHEINPPFVSLAKFTPLPGTVMYKEVVDRGLLDEEATDWTWAANQSLTSSFVDGMSKEHFLEIMEEVAQIVKDHNKRQSLVWSDPRMKD